MRKEIARRETKGGNLDIENEAKFGKEVGLCFGIWEEKAVISSDPAVFKYDFLMHLSKDELKAFKGEKPVKLTPPTMFDLSKAERVTIDKDEIKRQEMEKETDRLRGV